MNFIVSDSSGVGVAGLSDHDLGVPDRRALVVDAQREVRNVQDHMRLAEVARHPAPALHVGHDDLVVALLALAVERIERRVGELAVRRQALALLIGRDRVGERLVVEQIVLHGIEAEPHAQDRHALVLHQDGVALLVADELEHRTGRDLLRTRIALVAARIGELLAQRFVLRGAAADSCRATAAASLPFASFASTSSGSGAT